MEEWNMSVIVTEDLYAWCKIPAEQLAGHRDAKIPFRICQDSAEMGMLMARELADEIQRNNAAGRETRAIIPCGPVCWYEPFARIVNAEGIRLKQMTIFHMDECLDWQGNELPLNHPYSFRGIMEKLFYGPINRELTVPQENRNWLTPKTIGAVLERFYESPIDITYGGWGQDGHVAYNQARRQPYSALALEDLRNSSIRIQENNADTILSLAHRTFGAAYQFVPPMSVTLGMKECLSAKKIRLFSDTGSWKQTALRVALFGPVTAEYPITLLQEHPDALLTATVETARHPLSEHLEWDLGLKPEGYGMHTQLAR
jgi:glucosamine-6-phosphate deaminase